MTKINCMDILIKGYYPDGVDKANVLIEKLNNIDINKKIDIEIVIDLLKQFDKIEVNTIII